MAIDASLNEIVLPWMLAALGQGVGVGGRWSA